MRFVALLTLALASSAAAVTVIPVGEFRSVELSDGGHVIIRHGAVQRVTIVEGDPEFTRIRVGSGGRLLIDNTGKCPRGYRVQVEVVTPHLTRVAVSNGGRVETAGAFPAQSSIEAAVEQGGTVDIRSLPADRVEASVYSGGGIFTTARTTLDANVESGGSITYWGDAEVRKSVRDGGAVKRGKAPVD